MSPPTSLIYIFFRGWAATGTGSGVIAMFSDSAKTTRDRLSKASTMPSIDKRNVLHIGPPQHPGGTEITPAMVESVRQLLDCGSYFDF